MEITRVDSGVEIPRFEKPEDVEGDVSTPVNQTSRLLSLPAELQLLIWEFAVVSPTPLLINCACDSSYGGWTSDYYADIERWKKGTLHPPLQPPLTQVSRSIRADALPMFYKLNSFQAGYCYETDMGIVVAWLKAIGEGNRMLMGEFYFFDQNGRHDVLCEKDLKKVRRGVVVRELAGRVVGSSYEGGICRHDVVFESGEGEEWREGDLEGMFREVDDGV